MITNDKGKILMERVDDRKGLIQKFLSPFVVEHDQTKRDGWRLAKKAEEPKKAKPIVAERKTSPTDKA